MAKDNSRANIGSIQSQTKDFDKRYNGKVSKRYLFDKGLDWYNYPLTGKAPV